MERKSAKDNGWSSATSACPPQRRGFGALSSLRLFSVGPGSLIVQARYRSRSTRSPPSTLAAPSSLVYLGVRPQSTSPSGCHCHQCCGNLPEPRRCLTLVAWGPSPEPSCLRNFELSSQHHEDLGNHLDACSLGGHVCAPPRWSLPIGNWRQLFIKSIN